LVEIIAIEIVDFGRNLQRQSAALGDFDCPSDSLFRRDAA
jgi:hypothetical protein